MSPRCQHVHSIKALLSNQGGSQVNGAERGPELGQAGSGVWWYLTTNQGLTHVALSFQVYPCFGGGGRSSSPSQ